MLGTFCRINEETIASIIERTDSMPAEDLISLPVLRWSKAFPLSEAFTAAEVGGGIYAWGYHDGEEEMIWYVGKAVASKGIMRRLRKHYLDIMGGQYQIPAHFLRKAKIEPLCGRPGWEMTYDEQTADILREWSKIEPILRAGHDFAHSAIARYASLECSKEELKQIELQVISQINPVVNIQRGKGGTNCLQMSEDPTDMGWIAKWTAANDRRAAT
jgi:hypothetical protein